MPRILILHASVGTGHARAAEALRLAFERRQPGEVRVEDVLDYTPPLFRQAYVNAYLDLTKKAPLLWGYFYHQTEADPNIAELSNSLRRLVEGVGVTQLKDVLRSFQPAAIVCTHYLPVELLVQLRRRGELLKPAYCVVTDFSAHTFWATPGLDGYFVAADITRDQLVERGIAPQLIRVSGIPINPEVAAPKDRPAVRAARALNGPGPLVTLFGGGVESERLRAAVVGLLQSELPLTLAVVAGRNQTLVSALGNLQGTPAVQLHVFGMIDYVDDLVAASDLVITKSGGLIVSEVLARGVPMIVIEPIPGQEEWNADYIASSGAGVQLRMPYAVPRAVQTLLAQPERLVAMGASAAAIGRPRAAAAVVDAVLDDLHRH